MVYRTLLMVLMVPPIVFGYLGFDHLYGSVSIETFIRCDPSIPIWHGQLSIFEADPVGASELFKTVNFTTTDMSQHLMFEPFHPGRDWGIEYEIGYQLIHNCTHSGKNLCLSPRPTDVSAFGNQKVDWYIRTFEQGYAMKDCPDWNLWPHDAKKRFALRNE